MKLQTDKRLQGSQSPEIVDCVDKLQSKFGKYAIPDAEARQGSNVVPWACPPLGSEEGRLMREG